jgi:protein TonB
MMESKKSKKADLEKNRPLFLELGLVIVLAIVLLAFEWTTKPSKAGALDILAEDIGDEEIIPITRHQEKPPEPPPPPPKVIEVLNIVADDKELTDQLELDNMDMDQDLEMEFMPFEEEEAGEEEVFIIVEDMPKFQGGDQNAFRRWIQDNLRYPEIAAENGISGKVFVQFAVNSKGQVVDAKVIRGVDPALDKEALRVVTSSPRWEPGKQRGKPVKVQFTFPIVFVLQ